jgi:hypothetical protein
LKSLYTIQNAAPRALIHRQAERCLRLHIPVTLIAVMMKSNYSRLPDVARVAKQFDGPLRVNVYQAVRSDIYALSYEEYWEGFRRLFEETDVSLLASRSFAQWRGTTAPSQS